MTSPPLSAARLRAVMNGPAHHRTSWRRSARTWVGKRVHAAVAQLVVESDGADMGRITVSVGLAFCMPRRGRFPDDLFRVADAALYEAKSTGRNRTCYAVMDGHHADDRAPYSDADRPVSASLAA